MSLDVSETSFRIRHSGGGDGTVSHLPTTPVLELVWLLVQVRAGLGLARAVLKDPAISRDSF